MPVTAKQLLHPFKKDAFLNWRKTCLSQYRRFVWPQIVYTGSVDKANVEVIGVVFEINSQNQDVVHWDDCETQLKIVGLPAFYVDSRPSPPILFQAPPLTGGPIGRSAREWPDAFNSAFERKDHYDSFVEQEIESYEGFRRATNPRGTRACDLDAIEVHGKNVVGIEATEIWKVAPWNYFYKQFENVLVRRQGSYNLDAMMAQWIFISQHIGADAPRLLFILHKLIWTDFQFNAGHTLQPARKNGGYIESYFLDENGSGVIDDEAVCIYLEINEEVIEKLSQIQKKEASAYPCLGGHLVRRSIYDIYAEVVTTKEAKNE